MESPENPEVPAAPPAGSKAGRLAKAVTATIFCPGLGEWTLGRRRLALVFMAGFALAAIGLLHGSYGAVYGLAEKVKRQDPTLDVQPRDVGEAVALSLRLYPAILAEYRRESGAIRQTVGGPLLAILVLYVVSLIQCVVIALRDPPAGESDVDPPAGDPA